MFKLRNLPACKDWKGNEYPERVGVTLIDNLGHRWDGGEFLTRQEAISHCHKLGYMVQT